ncbi:hypothetical protein EVG20_g465 [Dentipellis fragilis]|uniref:Uncharacterized protein n=1 Tax=Dentipellis fragilis TaxID=205917 RepID=A0A4Y9ZEG5_9AGAM|nr:hypothetical protein EVG20_g465 [Dentipellis fragilis]
MQEARHEITYLACSDPGTHAQLQPRRQHAQQHHDRNKPKHTRRRLPSARTPLLIRHATSAHELSQHPASFASDQLADTQHLKYTRLPRFAHRNLMTSASSSACLLPIHLQRE